MNSRKSLAVIARDHLNDWKKLGPFLDLSRQQETAIANSSPDYGRECLEVWKENKGKEATYHALISAAEEAEDKELADKIRDLLREK